MNKIAKECIVILEQISLKNSLRISFYIKKSVSEFFFLIVVILNFYYFIFDLAVTLFIFIRARILIAIISLWQNRVRGHSSIFTLATTKVKINPSPCAKFCHSVMVGMSIRALAARHSNQNCCLEIKLLHNFDPYHNFYKDILNRKDPYHPTINVFINKITTLIKVIELKDW